MPALIGQNEPLTISLRVFRSDEGWRWELSVWRGDIDTRNTEPTTRSQSAKAFKGRRVAYRSGLAAAGKVP